MRRRPVMAVRMREKPHQRAPMRPRLRVATETPAAMGWWVANQVRPIAAASSAVLRAMLETGSGLGVTATRAAVFELCAMAAIPAPAAVTGICWTGERGELAA